MRQLKSGRRGFALLTALWLIVAISTVALEFSLQAQERRKTAINISERAQAFAAAEAGIATTRARLGRLATSVAAGQTGSGVGGETDQTDPLRWADSLFTDSIVLGPGAGSVSVIVRDVGAFLNPNEMSEQRWIAFLTAAGVDYGVAEQIAQSIFDWMDPDPDPRGRGAERDDYIRAGRLALPSNKLFTSVEELRDVMGMTPEIYARIAPYFSLLASGQINVNKADPLVLRSLPGMTDEIVAAILNQRYSATPIRSLEELKQLVPGVDDNRFNRAMPGEPPLASLLSFTTSQVLVTSIGWSVGGHTQAITQATLRVENASSTGPSRVVISNKLSW
jgi:general secretion pathway protein K